MKIESYKEEVSYVKSKSFKKIVVFTDSDGDAFEVREAGDGKIVTYDCCGDYMNLTFDQATKVAKALNKMVKELKPTVKKKVKK